MTSRTSRLALILGVLSLTLAAAGCDKTLADADKTGNDDSGSLSYVGFALTADDQSDDDFDEDSDPSALLDEFEEAFSEDAPPTEGEVDPIPAGDEDAPNRPELITRVVLVAWGQPTFNPDFEEPTVWNGGIGSDVARVRVLRKLRFDDVGDQLRRDDLPNAVSFTTVTGPHNDGLLIRVTAPRTPATMAGRLTFRTGHYTRSVPLADIFMGFQHTFQTDDIGNVLHITSVAPSDCPHGALSMRWKRIDERGGIFGGKVFGQDGEHQGYVVGLWGKIGDKRRFKGFYLNADRSFRGTLKGSWANADSLGRPDFDGGAFRGVWVNRAQTVRGVLGGVYRTAPHGGFGYARGVWRARCNADSDGGPDGGAGSCDEDLSLPAPGPIDCVCDEDGDNGMSEACACEAMPQASPTCAPPVDDLPAAE